MSKKAQTKQQISSSEIIQISLENPQGIESLKTEFYQGKYKSVIDQIGRNPLQSKSLVKNSGSNAESRLEELSFLQIGALVFLGELQEAQILYDRIVKDKNKQNEVSLLFKCRCRFYLGIGSVRRSNYSDATHYFALNLMDAKKIQNSVSSENTPEISEIIFYAYQGSAFFRFFKGQYKKTKDLAEQAYRSAFNGQFKYGQIFSLDLLGHSLCLLGFISRGLFELERALSLVTELGNGGVATALKISIVKYRAQFGLDLRKSIQNLVAAINSLDPQDTYSKAELYLELIRQLIIRGKGREAQKQLEQTGNLIYRHQNKRQTAIFNLRYSHLLLLRGETHAAMALISTLRLNLNPKVDKAIFYMVDDLEKKIRFKLESQSSTNSEEYRAINFIDNRVHYFNLERHGSLANPNRGEDPLGDIMDQANQANHANMEMFYEIKKLGLLGLAPKILGIPVGVSGIFLGPSRTEMLVVSGCDVNCIDRGITGPIKKLVSLLVGSEFKSKEFLINKTWGYDYDPSMHDRLLHATVGKLRNLLEDYSSWVEWSNEGYRLSPFVEVFKSDDDPKEQEVESIFVGSESVRKKNETDLTLNIRQIKILNWLKNGEFIGVTEYAKRYKICKMTACRDLTNLHQAGRIIKIGRARATVYGIA